MSSLVGEVQEMHFFLPFNVAPFVRNCRSSSSFNAFSMYPWSGSRSRSRNGTKATLTEQQRKVACFGSLGLPVLQLPTTALSGYFNLNRCHSKFSWTKLRAVVSSSFVMIHLYGDTVGCRFLFVMYNVPFLLHLCPFGTLWGKCISFKNDVMSAIQDQMAKKKQITLLFPTCIKLCILIVCYGQLSPFEPIGW